MNFELGTVEELLAEAKLLLEPIPYNARIFDHRNELIQAAFHLERASLELRELVFTHSKDILDQLQTAR